MDLTKKSMKWLVAVFVVFAMLLTAVFAVGNVATASATENEYDSAVHIWATDSAELGTYPTLVVSNAARTITVKYGFAIDAASAAFFNAEFAPVLNGSKPSVIALNSAFTGIVDIDDETDATGDYLAENGAKFFTIKSKENADISALNAYVNNEFDADKYLFSATYVLPAEATGAYTLSFASATISNMTLPSAYALSDSESYLPVIENPNFVINAPIPVPTPADVTYIYNGGPQTFQWAGTVDGHIAITNDVQTEADTYTVNVSLQDGYAWDETGYPTAGKTFPFVINKKSVTVPSLETSHFTYDGTSKSVSLVVASADQGYITEIEQGSTWQATNAGNYAVNVGLEDTNNTYWGDNENDVENKALDWDIAKVQISIAYNKESYSTTYGNAIDTPTAVVTGDVISGDNLNVSITGIPAAGSNVGTYPLHITYDENSNYEVTAAADKNYTITKALVEAAVTKTLANNTFTYTGEEITCEFLTNGSSSYFTITGHKQTNVGVYSVTETLNDPYNYKWSHFPNVSDDEPTAPYIQYDTFEITKKAVTIPTAVSGLIYTGSEQSGVNKVDGSYYDLVSGVESATAVDNYSATYRLLSTTNTYWAGNVDDVADKTVNWSIGKAQITKPTIEVSYKTYNGEAQTYSGSGTGYSFTGSGTNFGTYPVTVTLTDKDNYTWNDGTTADYEDADKLSIAKKSVTLTITKSASSSEYGSSVATITVSASGLIAENDLGTLSYRAKYSNGGSYVYYTKAEFEGTNPYPVAKSYILEQVYTANDNYYVSADSSPYTITPKAVTIAFSKASYTSVYGEPLEEISIGATGLVNAGDLGTISYVIMQNEQFVELVNVGEYSLVNTYTANPNYTVTQAGYATYTITAKKVAKPAEDNTTFTYNGSAQTYTLATNAAYTITGDTTKTNAGSNDITIALVDKTNTEWTTGGTADVEYTFTINKKAVTLDFYDSDDEEPLHYTFLTTYPDSMYYITVKATGLIGANDLGELGFTATDDTTHAVADITVEGAPAGYYILTPTYTPNANYQVTALEGSAHIFERSLFVPVVVTDTYYYDGTAKAIVFDQGANEGYTQYYTITGNSLTEPGTTTVTVALKDEYAGNVIWGYDARVGTSLETTDDQTFTLTVNSSAIHVTFTCSYGEAVTTIEENVEVNFVTGTMRALPNFRFFYTPGWKVGGEGDVVTAYTLDMDNATLNAQFTYNVGAGDVDGNGIVNTLDLIKMKRYYIGLETEVLEDAAAAWAAAIADTAEAPVFVSALDANGSGAFRINDLVTIREALATGYDFRIVIGRQGVTGQSIENVQVLTVYDYDEFVAAVKTGIPVKLGANITAEDERFNETIDIPVDIDLNGKALTVEYFGLNSNANDVTLSIKGGTIYAFDDIVITAPNGNVKLDNVTGYNYVTDEVILAAASNSLHFDRVVEFLKYPEGSSMFANKIAALNAIAALSSENEEEQAAAEAEFNNATKAEVSIPVDTHVVVEEAASLVVEKINVVEASNDQANVTTFSIDVKSTTTETVTVDVTSKVENDYIVEVVNQAGAIEKIDIVTDTDNNQTVTTDTGVKSMAEFEAALAVGGKVTLAADINIGNYYEYNGDDIVIDLNGHTMSANSWGFDNVGTKTVTIMDSVGTGKIDSVRTALSNENSGKIVINGGTINAKYPVANSADGEIIMNGGTINATLAGMYISGGIGKITVNGGTINGEDGIGTWNNAGNGAAVIMTGGTINATDFGISTNGNDTYTTEIIVSGGTINAGASGIYNAGIGDVTVSGTAVIHSTNESGVEIRAGSLTITGGTISSSASPIVVVPNGNGSTTGGAGVAVIQHTTKKAINVSITGGTLSGVAALYEANPQNNSDEDLAKITITIGSGATFDGEIVINDIDKINYFTGVARIGTVGYATLVDAVAAVNASENGGTITLLADLDFSDEVYAGYKWAGSTYNPLEITKDNVTIDLNGHTISNMGNSAICAGHLLAVNGRISNFTIKNGTLRVGQTNGANNSYALAIAGVDGALVKNVTTFGGINVFSGSRNVVIEDCTVQGTKYYTVCSQTGSEVTIKGTTYTKNTDYTVANKSMFWIQGAGTEEDMITPENPNGIIPASTLTIESGNFIVDLTNGGVFYLTDGVAPIVQGGTYNIDPSAYVPAGYGITEEGGIYTVAPLTGAAYIGHTAYQTFDAAVDAVQANETIVLLADVTYGTDRSVPVWRNKIFNIDLNGKTFTTNSEVGITLNNNGYTASAFCYSSAVEGTVTISNGTIRTAYGAGVYADDPGLTVILEDLDIKQNYPDNVQTTDEYSAAVRVTGFGHVIINSGSYSGKNAITISNSGGYVTINGGDFHGNLFISSGEPGKEKILTIKGGTFDADPTAYVDTDNYDVTLANGIYTVTAKA